MPMACEATPILPPSSAAMATWKPSPGPPSMFRTGTRQPSKASETVSDPRRPILRSDRPTRKPGVSGSRRKALISWAGAPVDALPFSARIPVAGRVPVAAITSTTPACAPLVMKVFSPSST